MIILGKTGVAQLVSSKLKKSKYEEMKESNEKALENTSRNEEGLDACCDEMMDAFHSKDNAKLKQALKNFIEMTKNEE